MILQLLQLLGGGGARDRTCVTRSLLLNVKIARLLRHLGVAEESPDVLPAEVADFWSQGKRVQAIRAYRKAAGVDLKEAKYRLEHGFPPPIVLLERNVDRLLKHHGLSPDTPLPMFAEVRDQLAKGRKIDAIRVYRDLTGADLRDAKEAVDQWERQMPSQDS